MQDPVTDLERLMLSVIKMRQAQRSYFARPNNVDKKIAMGLEIHVDEILVQLRKRGYDPMKHISSIEQKKMF